MPAVVSVPMNEQEKRREKNRAYAATESGKASAKSRSARYRAKKTPAYVANKAAAFARYAATEKGRAERAATKARYRAKKRATVPRGGIEHDGA